MILWRNAARFCATGLMMVSVGCQSWGPTSLTGGTPSRSKIVPTHSAQELLAVARQYEKEGDKELASVYFQRVLTVDPMNPEAARGLYLITTGRSREQHDIQQMIVAEKGKQERGGLSTTRVSPEQINADIARLVAEAAANAQVVQAQRTSTPTYAETPIQAFAAQATPTPVVAPQVVQPAAALPSETAHVSLSAPAAEPAPVASAPTAAPLPVITTKAPAQPVQVAARPTVDSSGWTARTSPFEPRSLIRLCRGADNELLSEVERLDHADAEIRKQGLTALAARGAKAQPARLAVKMLLDDADESIVAHAAWALWEIDGDAWQSVQPLAELLDSQNQAVVQFTCYTLGTMGRDAQTAVPRLRTVLASPDATLRLHAAEALISVDPASPQAVATLIQLTHHSSTEIRALAVMALGGVSPELHPGSVEALTLALRDRESQVRSTAALSLGALGRAATSALEPLREAATSDDTDVSEAAAAALACIDR